MSQRTIIGIVATALVVTMVVLGLTVIGSPTKARNRETDRLRVERLSQLHHLLENHATEIGQLPQSLKELSAEQREIGDRLDITRDPGTGAFWEYRKLDARKYEICVTFHEASEQSVGYSAPHAEPNFYSHGAGRTCFTPSVRSGPAPLIDHVQPEMKPFPPPGY